MLVIAVGVIVVLAGLLMLTGGLNWFGRLPGDIRIERDNTRIYIPITTMILLSVVLSTLTYIVRRLF
jgi:uncharacterized membrane protein